MHAWAGVSSAAALALASVGHAQTTAEEKALIANTMQQLARPLTGNIIHARKTFMAPGPGWLTLLQDGEAQPVFGVCRAQIFEVYDLQIPPPLGDEKQPLRAEPANPNYKFAPNRIEARTPADCAGLNLTEKSFRIEGGEAEGVLAARLALGLVDAVKAGSKSYLGLELANVRAKTDPKEPTASTLVRWTDVDIYYVGTHSCAKSDPSCQLVKANFDANMYLSMVEFRAVRSPSGEWRIASATIDSGRYIN